MPSGTQQNEIVQLQQSIAKEVNSDAPAIAQGIFGDNKNHPDMAQVSNQQLDDLYRQKFQAQDRVWLQAEARRDPNQFMDVAKRIGVSMPDPNQPTPATPDPNAMAKMLASATAGPTAPAPAVPGVPPGSAPGVLPPPALPAPPVAPVAPPVALAPPPGPAAPPPVILGPNGQPLPPSIPGVTG